MTQPVDRELAVFSAARRLPARERGDYLDEACAGDAALRERVEQLLEAGEEAGAAFLEEPAHRAERCRGGAVPLNPGATLRISPTPAEKPGDRIGRYKLLQQIGEGGCGVVYMAEQEEPVRRRVALKVIKLGMDTKQVITRFEAERQALAMMDHPNIAKVLEAGATDAGRPYFVMELVRGVKITEYCDQNNLSTSERLKLFIQVCHAVQHAHQKGIIHRDIKPSNILVASNDGAPVPKVIDFGIAKATQGRLTNQTLFTALEQFIGTPAYMSPEQAELTMFDVDTRTDIYSLGVLLYELLIGRTPFDTNDLLAAGLDAMRRTIREQEPERPSTRLSTMAADALTTTAKHRQIEAPRLLHLIRGDLDWIVMKALEKDRARRYETANGLAMDIQRHLAYEPVAARPPSAGYRLQKLVRRNKLAFAASTAVAGALVLGTIASTLQAVRATRAEREQSRLHQQAERAGNTARHQEQLARESADEARRQQQLAARQELLARRRFYAAQMNLANQAAESGQLGRALELLETQRPKSADEDLRSFEWYHLWGVCNSHLRITLRAHKDTVLSVAFSLDGKTLASASDGGSIRLWDTASGRERTGFKWPGGSPVRAVAFTPDGKILAAGSEDGFVRLYDTSTAKVRATLAGSHAWVRSVAISPDGTCLICGGDDGVIKLFDLGTEAEQMSLRAHQGPVLCLGFSQDRSLIYSASCWGSDGGMIKLWNLAPGLLQLKLQIGAAARALTLSPDGKMLASAAWERIQIWDASSGKLQATLNGHSPPIHSLLWLPDGQSVVSCASDRTIRLWPMPSTGGRAAENEIIGGHLDTAMCLAISPDGTTLASGASDGSVKIWNLSKPPDGEGQDVVAGFQLGAAQKSIGSLFFSPDGNTLFGVMEHATTAKNIFSGQVYPDLLGAIGHGALSPDGRLLATGDNSGILNLWDPATGRQLTTRKAHTSDVVRLAFSPDGRMLATCGFEDRVLKAWEAVSPWNLLWHTDTESAGISALAFSPNGKTVAAMVRHKRVDMFESSTGRRHYGLEVQRGESEVMSLAFSPDGKLLATGSESGTAKLWDLDQGKLHAALQGHTGMLHDIAFSPDGGTIATSSEDETIRLWDVATGQERITLKPGRYCRAVTFSPDGNTLAAARLDGLVRLWRAKHVADATGYREPEAEIGHGSLAELAKARLSEGQFPEAERIARQCLALREREIPDDWRTFNARSMLGGALLGQSNYAQAEPLLLSGYEGMKQRAVTIPAEGKPRLGEAVQRLVQLYEATGRPDQAAEWKKKLVELDQSVK